jgi:outer membrane protein insertion porin family
VLWPSGSRLARLSLAAWIATIAAASGAAARQGPEPQGPPLAGTPGIGRLLVTGSVDPPGKLEGLLGALLPPGAPFVEPAEIERAGAPVGTVPRLREILARLGYESEIRSRVSAAGAVDLEVRVRPLDRLRYIFVSGNGYRMRQDDIIRRIALRPGQALPPAGPARAEWLERERQSVLALLRDEGYFDARVAIRLDVRRNRVPASVSMRVHLELGQGFPIGPITVRGAQALGVDEISARFRHEWLYLWTRPFKLRLLQDDRERVLERYHQLGFAGARVRTLFDPTSHVDYQKKEVRLGVDIYENKRVDVAFEGNRRFEDDDLKESVTFFERGSFSNHEKDASAEAVAQRYRNKGHMFVRVTWRRELVSPQVERVVFSIEEGPSLKVRSVKFQGNRALSSGALAEHATVKVFPPLGALGLGEGGYASLRQVEINEDRIEDYYAAIGHPDAQVRAEIAPDGHPFQPVGSVRPEDPRWRAAQDLHVRFLVVEGPLVTVSSIDLELAPGEALPMEEAHVRKSLQQLVGRPFARALVREDVATITRLLGDAGHPEAAVEPLPTREGDRVRLRYQIKVGPRLTVGPIFIRGNFLTAERTILQWIPLRPGSLLETSRREAAERNLALVQLFANPNPIKFPEELRVGNEVPMVIDVEERHDHWGVLRLGGGASRDQRSPRSDLPFGVYVSAGYEHRNLLGLGWTLRSSGQLGTSVREVRVDFLNQRLLETPFRLELGGSYRREATLRLGDLRTGEGTVGLARFVYPGVDVALRYSLRNTTRTELLLRGAGADEHQQTANPETTVGAMRASVEWQRLDNPLVPTRGFKLVGAVELALPELSLGAGEDRFVKTQVRLLSVVPLLRRWSLRASARYDHGFVLGGRSVLPRVERFFLGGDTTVRGYELDMARREALVAEVGPGLVLPRYRPVGGSFRVISNLELQFHLAGLLYSTVFLDSGLLADSPIGSSARSFRHGAGFSPLVARFPVGDLSVSWAWPLDPQPGDTRTGRLHVNIGLMF